MAENDTGLGDGGDWRGTASPCTLPLLGMMERPDEVTEATVPPAAPPVDGTGGPVPVSKPQAAGTGTLSEAELLERHSELVYN